jgi:hypothetical protein
MTELIKNKHYPVEVIYDLLGQGWRMECACGEQTSPCQHLEDAGAEMDDHMERVEDVA